MFKFMKIPTKNGCFSKTVVNIMEFSMVKIDQ